MTHALLRWPRVITTALGAAIVACVLALVVETDWGRALHKEAQPRVMPPAKAAAVALLPAFALGGLEQNFPESAARPLFLPTRRPVLAGQQVGAMVKGRYTLVGTSMTKEFGNSAMLREVASKKTSVIKQGATFDGMTLDAIAADRVTLKQGDDAEELVMKASSSVGLPPVPIGSVGPLGVPAAFPGMPQPAAAAGRPASGPGGTLPGGARAPNVAAQPIPARATATPGATGQPSPGLSPAEEILERRRRARAQQTQ